MLPEIPDWCAVIVALVPPTLKWWWGRALAGRPDDPLLPERLQAQRRRTGAAAVTAAAALLVVWPLWAVGTLTLLVAHLAAGYPLRRALYGETWSLPTYLWFFIRLNV